MTTIRGYTGSCMIPPPLGIDQSRGEMDTDPRYAYRAVNLRTGRGMVGSACGRSRAFASIGQPIETLTRFCRRNRPDDPDVYVAAAGGAIYTYTAGTAGWVKRLDGLKGSRFSHVTYETQKNGETVDMLILSSAADGMLTVEGDDLSVVRRQIRIGTDGEEVRFAVLSRYAERIWGTGAPGYPDSLFYSRPYDPLDWTADTALPEMGGGRIDQPTWDGQAFTALVPFGGYLLAIKPQTAYELRGTDPESFTMTQAYGTDGPVNAETICTDGTRVYFLTRSGPGMYDGSSLTLFARDSLCELTARIAAERLELATACMAGHVYRLAVCLKTEDGTVPAANNAVIEYDTRRGSFMLREGLRVRDFYAPEDVVYMTDAQPPYEVYLYADEQGGTVSEVTESLWETGWTDLGRAGVKREMTVRLTARAEDDGVPLRLTMETERREKTRVVMLRRGLRDYRVRMAVSGRRVRLRIRVRSAQSWAITGGIRIEYTADE